MFLHRERPVDGLVFASAAGRDGLCTVLGTLQPHCLDPGDPEPDEHTALRLVPGHAAPNQPLSSAPHSDWEKRPSTCE